MIAILLVILVVVPAVAAIVEWRNVAAGRAAHPMPGRLVDVGGHRLHVVKEGAGGPTVVFEAGSGEAASSWTAVADGLDRDATVVRYDRAGYGWSEASKAPRTGEQITAELHTALDSIGAPKPYVLVGHSLGGLYVREFARRYPGEVAGLVLVDARPEDDARRTASLLAGTTTATTLPPWIPATLKTFGLLRVAGGALLDGLVPAEQREEFLDVTAGSPGYFGAKQEEADLIAGTEDAVRRQQLGDLPVRVIARGLPQDYAAAGIDATTGAALEQVWQDGQRRMLELSRDSRLMIAEHSGHLVPYEQPSIIIDAVREVLAGPIPARR
ncbi:hypothetical protein AMIS_9600 [Actinoplanes missouriensis 431]|uniref:AB hydrolase-1 domain-containing protein n=1 Tax=Actinoplanes missouriensis (strain ATCC 14538 / DSM 43046 / CBS 188.64 / JCM 3121 / NBRC 102363 / NCIMB 12654 / NRRL B-3342 / UNCC 431) TaxID=512565 RepID=I0GZJ3_ACTM4|nr:alpha/beta hydrolase [Actinoplanes missouriensis]BAL86180.1 hypothetical protein AMIS_9600 [Actinoplanes missouriensis 431]